MRATLERPSPSGVSLAAPSCRQHVLRTAGLVPLRCRPCNAHRAPLLVQAASGSPLLDAAQKQAARVLGTLDLGQRAQQAVQSALAATAAFFQRLAHQIWLAAMAVHAATLAEEQRRAAAAAAAAQDGSDGSDADAQPGLLEMFAAVSLGAAERLRHTLCDASCSLDTKWTALESTVGSAMGGLFHATSKSAEALNTSLAAQGGAGAPSPSSSRAWQQEAEREVVKHEDALYQQVFVQVYQELLSKDNRSIGYNAS